MDFITIDFETATSDRDSPCEIGLTFVKNREITETRSWLIKPRYAQFNYFNILIHGIRPEHVADQPEFNELWTEIGPLLQNQFLIAHNAGFDMGVLRKTLESYQLPYPTLSYSCSYLFSRKIWQGLSGYDLKTLCRINSIPLNHHRAGDDSRATAALALKAFDVAGIYTPVDLQEKLKINLGQLYEGGHSSSRSQGVSASKAQISGDPSKHNPDSIFYRRTVVFTGTLSSMTRTEAKKLVADTGGLISESVNGDTGFLVVGQQDYRVVGDAGMSSKQKKAIQLVERGSSLEILSEEDFLKNI